MAGVAGPWPAHTPLVVKFLVGQNLNFLQIAELVHTCPKGQ